jgi:hypothetical protein
MNKPISHRRFGVLMLSVMCTVLASGQVRIGVHGGVNLSDVTEPPNYHRAGTWEMRTYCFGGIVADFQFAPHWELATEVNIIQKGIRIPLVGWGLSYPGTVTLKANYYEVPLKIRYRSGGDPIGWYVEGGPSLAIVESGWAHMVTEHLTGLPQFDQTDYIGGMYRTFQPSLMAGVGAEYKLTSLLTVVLSASYTYGLSDVYDDFWADTKSRDGACDLGLLFTL